MKEFKRRYYHGLRPFFADLGEIVALRRHIRPLMRNETISLPLRERLMLAVTAVNRCRYCSYFHARVGLEAGLTAAEIAALDQGVIGDCPVEEQPLVYYAQHWAEQDGHPDPAARELIKQRTGEEKLVGIELALRFIRIGNLLGNSFDYWLWRFSRLRRSAPAGRQPPTRPADRP